MDSVSEKEKLIDQYLSEGKQDDAVKALFDLIVESAKNKDFTKAEALRDKLLEVAPMALNEITESADIIDEEKSDSIDEAHHETWSDLYGNLTPEEGNDLYFAMKEKIYNEGQTVFSIGDADTNLYFIDDGEAKIVFKNEDEEILIKDLGPGDTSGGDTFFYTTAFRTVYLIAVSKVKIRYIERKIQEKWKESSPGLIDKIDEYCRKSGLVPKILEEKGLDRRVNKRPKISGKVGVQLLKSSGDPAAKPFIGELINISEYGLAFSFKLSKNEVAHKLLGGKVKTKLAIPVEGVTKEIEQPGIIAGIGYPVLSDHTIHVRFDKPDETIKKVIGG